MIVSGFGVAAVRRSAAAAFSQIGPDTPAEPHPAMVRKR